MYLLLLSKKGIYNRFRDYGNFVPFFLTGVKFITISGEVVHTLYFLSEGLGDILIQKGITQE